MEKIKTIGDGYMAVTGVSLPQDDHLCRLARMALGLPELVERLSAAHGVDLRVRIGIAIGPVMAGIIGTDKFSYDVWGETVNLASRLELHGLPGEIQVSGAVREALGDGFLFESRGPIRGQGRGAAGDLAAQAGARARAHREGRARMTAAWRATVLTIFPEMFPGPLGLSLAGKALAEGKWALHTIDIRDFATDKHRSVDDTPAGGGAGMVMRADIASAAIDAARADAKPGTPTLYLSPRGKTLTQARARALAQGPGAILLCGRFEGVDQRVLEAREIEEISIGDYVLSGGELAAQVLIDACVRLIPGVAGNEGSLAEESFAAGLLEYPHYTRPRDFEGRAIPDVLLSGDHQKIAEWRRAEAERLTQIRRPDLWEKHKRKP